MSAPNLRDMWLSELWGKCPELSYGERLAKRLSDAVARETLSAQAGDNAVETVHRVAS